MTTEELATEDADKVSEEDIAIRESIKSEVWDEGDDVNSKPVEKELESEKETEKEKEPEPKTEEDETSPDPWEGVNPALKEMLENIKYRLGQTEKRVGSIQNKKATEAVKVDEAPTKEQIEESEKNEESWNQLKEDFPEWADAIDGKLAASSATLSKELPKLQEALTKTMNTMEANFERKLELRTIEFYHKDWEQIKDSPDYKTWIPSQSDELKDKHLHGTTAKDVIEVLNAYKEFKKPKEAAPDKGKTAEQIAADRKKRLQKSTSLETTHTEKPAKSELDMTEQELRAKIKKEVYDEDG